MLDWLQLIIGRAMFTFLRRHTILVFTLLAMLSQGVFASTLMMDTTSASQAMMSVTSSDKIMDMQSETICKTNQTSTFHCSEPSNCGDNEQNSMLPGLVQNCCDSDAPCKADCNHCLVISITATLLNLHSWSGYSPSEFIFITQMLHFHSISLAQDIRPPIA